VLVGFAAADDAGVFRIDADHALVQTLDFFTPIVDDPFCFGAIAAANALSDVYAMGGTPLTAMAIACSPDAPEDLEILAQVMRGGADKLHEAGVPLIGGHTLADRDLKFGYSVTGLVHPGRILTNAGAQPGDALILTKPLGIGIITTAIKRGRAGADIVAKAVRVMTTLNRDASETLLSFRCHAATDITGFGLLGHGCEMADASHATLRFHAASVPFLAEAYTLAEEKIFPGMIAKSWNLIEPRVVVSESVAEPLRLILLDPQTSGGLLAAVHPQDRNSLLEALQRRGVEAVSVGEVETQGNASIVVD
jgi:selenide,water dikinase